MMSPLRLLPLALGVCLSCAGARGHEHDDHPHAPSSAARGSMSASAEILPRSGSKTHGVATFEEKMGGVQVTITLRDAPPGWHAVHVHEVGDCSADDASSAGGHFNPDSHAHGAPHALEHHAGDLGNLWVNDDGTGYHAVFMPELTVAAGSHSVVGRSIIVHELPDDLVSQPTGAAGGRIGCGEIK